MFLIKRPLPGEKPRVKFCWFCSKKLYGNHHRIIVDKETSLEYIVHADCATEAVDQIIRDR